MTWMSDMPTTTGFYWYREPSRESSSEIPYVSLVKVVICEESSVAELGRDGDRELETFKGQWIGPLEIPK